MFLAIILYFYLPVQPLTQSYEIKRIQCIIMISHITQFLFLKWPHDKSLPCNLCISVSASYNSIFVRVYTLFFPKLVLDHQFQVHESEILDDLNLLPDCLFGSREGWWGDVPLDTPNSWNTSLPTCFWPLKTIMKMQSRVFLKGINRSQKINFSLFLGPLFEVFWWFRSITWLKNE